MCLREQSSLNAFLRACLVSVMLSAVPKSGRLEVSACMREGSLSSVFSGVKAGEAVGVLFTLWESSTDKSVSSSSEEEERVS